MIDWRSLEPLRKGTARQQAAVRVLDESGILAHLAAFDPVLAGTFPLDIDVAGSDLDVLCYAPRLNELEDALIAKYSHSPGFQVGRKFIGGRTVIVSCIRSGGFVIEVFGDGVPIESQHAFRHMLIEHRLLQLGGAALRDQVRTLKQTGLKTEPAFAQILGLPGDPYEALLALSDCSDEELKRLVARCIE